MINFMFLMLLVVIVLLLFVMLVYLVLSKSTEHGKTEFDWEMSFLKLIYIKLRTKHTNNKK